MGAPVVHFEIGCKDNAKTAGFYSKLLGWNMQAYGPASMIDTGNCTNDGKVAGPPNINGHINSLGHEPHNYCVVYAMVDDLEGTIKKAQELGGSPLVPPQEVPGMGHFAWIKDPEGTIFGLWKAMQR